MGSTEERAIQLKIDLTCFEFHDMTLVEHPKNNTKEKAERPKVNPSF